MGVAPGVETYRKSSLAPLKSAERAPVSTFGAGVERSTSKGSGTTSSEQRSTPDGQGGWASHATTDSATDSIPATLSGVATDVKGAIKAFEQSSSLPYDDVPVELCQPRAGTRSVDLSDWSLLVNDTALRQIAMQDRDRIEKLARDSSVKQVGSHIAAMGLTNSVKEVAASGVARFDPSSMVAWREKQTLDCMKTEEFERAKEHFASQESLTCLDIGGAEAIGDGGLAVLTAQCRRLQSLNISGAHRVTDVSIRSLAVNCTGLARLNLRGCFGIGGPGLAAVGECCPKLQDLDLSGCRQIGHWVLTRIFRGCHELETVSLARCTRVGDEELKELGVGCRGLVKLDLRGCIQVSDTGVLEVARHCSSLTTLDLARSELPFKVGDVTLLALGEGCPGLQRLDVAGCDGVTDVGLAWMANGCPALEYLDISGCVKVSNVGVTSLCERCPLLVHLGMAHLKYVTDIGVARLGVGCPILRHLDMTGFVTLSDGMQRDFAFTGVQALAKSCTGLETLILNKCFQVAKMALRAVGGSLHSLRRLSLSECPALTLEGLSAVAKGCPSLTDLNLSNCGSAVTDTVVITFARSCRRLQRMSLRGVVGVPPPLGAPGIMAVCSYCRELTFLDLAEVWGLEDAALVGFHENRLEKLERVNLMNCPKISGVGVQWLAEGCPALSFLNVKGTKVTMTALNIINERYPYGRIKVGDKFFGLSPLKKTKERIAIKSYASLEGGAIRIQGCFRAKKAREKAQVRRLRRSEEKAARMVADYWRRKKGRAHLQALRLLKNREENCAIVVQKMWRKAIARSLVGRLRGEREELKRARCATDIQRTYRGVRGRRKANKHRIEVLKLRKRKAEAALKVQQRFRMYRAKATYKRLRAAAELLRIKREKASKVMQSRWRSYRARQELERMKRLWREGRARREAAAAIIQKAVRCSRCRKTLGLKVRERARKHVVATVIQRHYRGACARVLYAEKCALRQVEREKAAALRLQCWHRVMNSKALLTVLAFNKELKISRERNAAKAIGQFYRKYRIRIVAQTRRQHHEDEMRAMSRLEDWAATRIQALARGTAGRAKAAAHRLEHMGRWKEMYDEDRRANFYYNKVSGEIRWRRPQDFLELLPRPSCGDCGLFEAFSECAGCAEFFCSSCYRKVHSGGKRIHHEFRALYDYYGKRVDYGEGEFPSCWPADIAQDEENGWQLRVSPEREASEERQDWARYAGDSDGRHPGDDLYYNARTGESTYKVPSEWKWTGPAASDEAGTLQALDTTSYEEEYSNGDWSYGVSEAHGNVTYDGTSESTIFGYEGHGGASIDDGWTANSSSGEWSKHYDAEYAVDYFYNSRTLESQYERPAGFQTHREQHRALEGEWGG